MRSNNSNSNKPLYLLRENEEELKQIRSKRAKKGWITRRANIAARQREENVDRNYEEQRIGGRVVRTAHHGNAIDYAIDNHSSFTPEKVLQKN